MSPMAEPHQEVTSSPPMFSCVQCGARFKTLQALGGHKSVHSGAKRRLPQVYPSSAPSDYLPSAADYSQVVYPAAAKKPKLDGPWSLSGYPACNLDWEKAWAERGALASSAGLYAFPQTAPAAPSPSFEFATSSTPAGTAIAQWMLKFQCNPMLSLQQHFSRQLLSAASREAALQASWQSMVGPAPVFPRQHQPDVSTLTPLLPCDALRASSFLHSAKHWSGDGGGTSAATTPTRRDLGMASVVSHSAARVASSDVEGEATAQIVPALPSSRKRCARSQSSQRSARHSPAASLSGGPRRHLSQTRELQLLPSSSEEDFRCSDDNAEADSSCTANTDVILTSGRGQSPSTCELVGLSADEQQKCSRASHLELFEGSRLTACQATLSSVATLAKDEMLQRSASTSRSTVRAAVSAAAGFGSHLATGSIQAVDLTLRLGLVAE